jgi:hypothetical protein
MEFTGRRTRSLARLAAYTLLLVFLVSLLSAALPLPIGHADRAMLLFNELLERSPLALMAVLTLYFGLADEAQPAIWEVILARWLRPLLRLTALAYLLVAVAVIALADRIEDTGVGLLSTQVQTSLAKIERLRQSVDRAADPQALLRTLQQQDPRLVQAMLDAGVRVGEPGSLSRQQALARELLQRAEANLRQASQRRRADASGNLSRQSVRQVLVALCYALFYLLASFIWPRSVSASLESAIQRRQARALEEQEALDPTP